MQCLFLFIKVSQAKTEKRKGMEEEIKNLNVKKRKIESDIAALNRSADSFADQAETKGDLTLIAKSNSMRKTSKEKVIELSKIEQTIAAKLLELKD